MSLSLIHRLTWCLLFLSPKYLTTGFPECRSGLCCPYLLSLSGISLGRNEGADRVGPPGLFGGSGREEGHWVTQTLWRNELVREGEETGVMVVTKGGPDLSPSSQPLLFIWKMGILSFLPKVQGTPSLWIKFLVFPFLWVAIPKFFLYGNSGAATDSKKLGTGKQFDFLNLSG